MPGTGMYVIHCNVLSCILCIAMLYCNALECTAMQVGRPCAVIYGQGLYSTIHVTFMKYVSNSKGQTCVHIH
jgi:hypothetical protein